MEKSYVYYDNDRIAGDPSVKVKKYVDTSITPNVQMYAVGMYAAGEETYAPGGSMKNMPQPYYEVVCITAGEFFFSCGSKKKHLKKGDFLLIRPKQNFSLENRGNEIAVRRYVILHPGPVVSLLLDFGILSEMLFLSITEKERIYGYMDELFRVCQEQSGYVIHTISTLCYSLLTEITRQCEWHDKSSEFKRITYLMARLPARKYTTASLAADCGVSVRTLYNLFMKEKNCSPVEYLIRSRMGMAQFLFKHEDLAVSDVAVLCGYNNIPFFTREFKKRTGMTPAAFAREHRNKKKGKK